MSPRLPAQLSAPHLGRRVRYLVAIAASLLLLAGGSAAQIDSRVGSDGVIDLSNSSSSSAPSGAKTTAKKSRASRTKTTKPSTKPRVVMPSDRSTARLTRYDATIAEAAALYRLPEAYIRAVMKTESNFDPRAVSPAGAIGLMQLMPFTAERMMVTDIFDPRQNIMGGARYLRILANHFNGDIHLTTAAYNAGEGAVIRYGGIPPYEETQFYVVKVLEAYEKYRAQELN